MENDLGKCAICGSRLTMAWVDNVYQVVCCNKMYGQCNDGEKKKHQRELLLDKLRRDGFIMNGDASTVEQQ